MSRYGTFPYTVGILYGPAGVSLFRISNFKAISRTYGNISLSWDNPSGQWNRLRLVRSQYGFPATPSDGTILFTSNSGPHAFGVKDNPINSFEDDGHLDGLRLTPGKTYYYTLWVEYSQGAPLRWARGADAFAIPVTDRNYLDYLLRRLPSVYTNRDMQVDGQPSLQSSGMSRFMSILAFDLSRYRDTLESLRDVNDPDSTNGLLLPSMGTQLAYSYEPEIGMRQNRVLLRNATYLAQRKGTSLGVTGLVSSVTGWGTSLRTLKNLIHDDNDASAKVTTGRWVATGGTLARNTSVAVPTDNAYTQEAGAFAYTATATSGTVSLYDDSPIGKGIPVVAGTEYVFSTYLRSATTSRTPGLNIKWYDGSGTLLSTSSATSSATSTTAWIRSLVSGIAPANACFATININYPTLTVGGVQYFKSVQFEPSKNLLTPAAASFEDGTVGGWTSAQSGLASSTDHAFDGTRSLKVTTSNTSDNNLGALSVTAPSPGIYTFSVYVWLPSSGWTQGAVNVNRESGTATVSTLSNTSTSTVGSFKRISVTLNVTVAGTAVLVVRPSGALTVGQLVYLDAAQWEAGSSATAFAPEPTEYRPAREVLIDVLPTRTNEILNPSFETDAAQWNTSTGGTIARSTAKSREGGLASGSYVPNANADASMYTGTTTMQFDKAFVGSAYVLLSTGTGTSHVRVEFYNGGTLVSTVTGATTATKATDWTRLTVQGRTPASGWDTAYLIVKFISAVTTTTYYVDDAMLEHNDLIQDYFDKRTEPDSCFIDGGISAGNGRTYLYPLYPARFTRAKTLAENAVLLGTRVTLKPVFV